MNAGVVNHMKLAIADAGDSSLDSNVFLGAGTLQSGSFLLEPSQATNCIDTSHTVTATLVDPFFIPMEGVEVTFTVLSGPNVGLTGTDVTDVDGQATFTYAGALPGTDILQASYAEVVGDQVVIRYSNQVEKIWVACGGAQIYGYVFDDLNVDGWRNVGETTGPAGVLVKLTQGATLIDTYWSSAPSGWYDFGIRELGSYCVEIVVPAGYVPTSPTKVCFTLTNAGKAVNFGLDKARANIGDLVFLDVNSNGVYDAGDYGIGNVTVALWTASGGAPGAIIATTTTAADGTYLFANILPGEYFVQVTDANGELTGLSLTTAGNPLGPITVVHLQTYLDADFGYNLVCSSTAVRSAAGCGTTRTVTACRMRVRRASQACRCAPNRSRTWRRAAGRRIRRATSTCACRGAPTWWRR